jgi:hypothetical protein
VKARFRQLPDRAIAVKVIDFQGNEVVRVVNFAKKIATHGAKV